MRSNQNRSKLNNFDFGSFLSLLTAIAALMAVVVGYLGIRLQHRIAAAQVKPLLTIENLTSLDFKDEEEDSAEVRLVNEGNGTAVITYVCFRRNDQSGLNLRNVLEISDEAQEKELALEGSEFGERLGERPNYLRSESPFTLLKMSVKRRDHYSQARKLFDAIGEQIGQTTIIVKFEDVFGNKQPTFRRTFDDPTKVTVDG